MTEFDPSAFLPENGGDIQIPSYLSYSTLIDLFLSKLRQLSATVERLNVHENTKHSRIGVQNFSDWHIGKKVVLNKEIEYNSKIAKERLDRIFLRSAETIKRWGLKKIVVAINGDMVEGGGVNFLHQPYTVDEMVDDQISIAALKLWQYIMTISPLVDEVTVLAVPGNHGRAKIPDPTANFDLMVYRYLHQMILHQQQNGNYDNVRLSISTEQFINYSPYKDFKIHIRHMTRAKQIKTAAGRARFLATCNIHQAQVILSGHWHNPTCEMAQNKWNIINGSLVGMDTYAEELTLRSEHSQSFVIFDNSKLVGIELLS